MMTALETVIEQINAELGSDGDATVVFPAVDIAANCRLVMDAIKDLNPDDEIEWTLTARKLT